jgi:hypothetical protein
MKSYGVIAIINSLIALNTNEGKRQFVLNAVENGDIVVFFALICGSFGTSTEKKKSVMGTVIKRKYGMFTIKVDKSNIACGIYTAFPADILRFVRHECACCSHTSTR